METKGCVVRVTRKYSRMDRARIMKGFEEEEQLLLLLFSRVVGGRSIVTSCGLRRSRSIEIGSCLTKG